jgi:hypothetical protein
MRLKKRTKSLHENIENANYNCRVLINKMRYVNSLNEQA